MCGLCSTAVSRAQERERSSHRGNLAKIWEHGTSVLWHLRVACGFGVGNAKLPSILIQTWKLWKKQGNLRFVSHKRLCSTSLQHCLAFIYPKVSQTWNCTRAGDGGLFWSTFGYQLSGKPCSRVMRGCLCEGCSSRLVSEDQCTEASLLASPKTGEIAMRFPRDFETCVQHSGWKRVEKRSASCWCQVFRMKSHEITAVFCAVLLQKFLQWIWQAPNRSGSHLNALGSKTPSKNSERNELLRFTWQRWTNGETLVPSSIPTIWASGPALCQPLGPRCDEGFARWPAGASPCWEKREKQN